MTETIHLILNSAGTFFVAVGFGWAVGKLRAARHDSEPRQGAIVRVRGREAVYRCRLDKIDSQHWSLGPPLLRDRFFPLEPGEKVTCQVEVPDGSLTFRTEVLCVDEFKGRIWLKKPKRTYLGRRAESKIGAAPAFWDGSGRFAR